MVAGSMGGMGQYLPNSDSNYYAGPAGGAPESVFNLPVSFNGPVSVFVGDGGIGGYLIISNPFDGTFPTIPPTAGTASSFGSFTVLPSTGAEVTYYNYWESPFQVDLYGYNGGGYTGGQTSGSYASNGNPGTQASVYFFGGSSGGPGGVDIFGSVTDGNAGGGSGGHSLGGAAGIASVNEAGGGGAGINVFGVSGDGADGSSLTHKDGYSSTIIGAAGGGGAENTDPLRNPFFTKGGNGKGGYVAVFWIDREA